MSGGSIATYSMGGYLMPYSCIMHARVYDWVTCPLIDFLIFASSIAPSLRKVKVGQERNIGNPATRAVTKSHVHSLKARRWPRTNAARVPLLERFNAELVEVRPPAAHALQRRDLLAPVKRRLSGEDGVEGAERQVTHFRRRHAAPRRRRPGAAPHHGLQVFREEGRERRGHRVEPQRGDVEALVQVLPRRPCRVVGGVLKWSDPIQFLNFFAFD